MTDLVSPTASTQWRVQRSSVASRIGSGALILTGLALSAVPRVCDTNVVQQLTSLLIFLILAVMWNALARYAGLVSAASRPSSVSARTAQFSSPSKVSSPTSP